jgi:hypothetical protein
VPAAAGIPKDREHDDDQQKAATIEGTATDQRELAGSTA